MKGPVRNLMGPFIHSCGLSTVQCTTYVFPSQWHLLHILNTLRFQLLKDFLLSDEMPPSFMSMCAKALYL